MSDAEKGSVKTVEHGANGAIQLTNAQYERLFFQPGGPPAPAAPKQLTFGNPTPFALAAYLLTLTPTVCMLAQWDGAAPTSFPGIVGAFYFVGGFGMTVGGLFEWVAGNTFPFVVFTSFGGFWLSLGVLFDPAHAISSAFAGGEADPALNHGLQFYLTFWVVLCIIYLIASLRTNVAFVYIFFSIGMTVAFLAAAYRQAGLGNASKELLFLRVAGYFGITNCICGWYLFAGLIFMSVDMPFTLPFGDLSWFLAKKKID